MAAIKRFFEKKKLEIKFKTAGEGHKLTEDTRQRQVFLWYMSPVLSQAEKGETELFKILNNKHAGSVKKQIHVIRIIIFTDYLLYHFFTCHILATKGNFVKSIKLRNWCNVHHSQCD